MSNQSGMGNLELSELSYSDIEDGIAHFITCFREVLNRMENNPQMERSKLTILKNLEVVLNEQAPGVPSTCVQLADAIFEMIDPPE